jgi:hypothetical protein
VSRNHRNWIQAYVEHTRYSESPDNFHFWTAVGTVAGALRRRVWIEQNIFQWTPNFYIILVGPPGVAAKSTSIRQGLNLLSKIEGINFGPQSMTWQALTMDLERAREVVEFEDRPEPEIMSCLTIAVSELGTFLKADDDELLSVLIDMWDGQKGVWKRNTKSSGNTEIHNPWINLIGCTTPSWIRANVPTTMVGGGLTSRIIFVYGEQKRQLVAYPARQVLANTYESERIRLTEDLQQIANIKGPYELTEDAIEWGAWWYSELNSKRANHMKSDRFDGYLARKQTHVHKLAMVLAASQRNELVITRDDLETSVALMDDIEQDMLKVFNSIGLVAGVQNMEEIRAIIKHSGGVMEYALLWRAVSRTMPLKTFTECIQGLLVSEEATLQPEGGKKIIRLKKNPLI